MNNNSMALFRHHDVDDVWGLAFDEAMAQEISSQKISSMLRLYNYQDHCVLLGRFQRTEAEVNLHALRERNISLNRRPTGGGAILMGKDQLGIAFAIPSFRFSTPKEALICFATALNGGFGRLSISSSLKGKNDIEVEGRKIAGLGLYKTNDGLLLHASVLLDLDIELMLSLLRIPASKLGSHGVKSIAERITTIRSLFPKTMPTADLESALISSFEETFGGTACDTAPPEVLMEKAHSLKVERYSSDTWLFDGSRNGSREFVAEFRSSHGTIALIISHQADVIKSVLVTGDYLETPHDLIGLENALRWSVIDKSVIIQRLTRSDCSPDFIDPVLLATVICQSYEASSSISEPIRLGSCYIPERRLF